MRQELAWLANIPFPFAHQGYLRVLSETRDKVGFDLVLHFDRDVATESLAASIEAAALDRTPRPRGGNVFLVATPQFAARHENTTSTKSRTYYDTGPLHRWFKERGVPLLVSLTAQGLVSVEIEL